MTRYKTILRRTLVTALVLIHTPFAAPLTQQEKNCVATHALPAQEAETLDLIFNNLDPALLALLEGKLVDKTREEIKALFTQAGFTIHTLRLQVTQPGTDHWPARAVLTHKAVPDYFIKIGFDIFYPRKNLSRIIRAQLINTIIDTPEYDITTINKIEKKLYKRPKTLSEIPADQHPLNDYFYIVLSPKIEGTMADQTKDGWLTFRNCSDKHYQDFIKLAELIEYEDPSPGNIIMTPDGKMTIIDTEILLPRLLQESLETFLGETDE